MSVIKNLLIIIIVSLITIKLSDILYDIVHFNSKGSRIAGDLISDNLIEYFSE